MANSTRPIQFREYLPEVFRVDEKDGVSFLSRFLGAFETLFEELQGEVEGTPARTSGGIADLFNLETTPPAEVTHRRISLTVQSVSGNAIVVAPFATGPVALLQGSLLTTSDGSKRTGLAETIPANEPAQTRITVEDSDFGESITTGDSLYLQLIPDFDYLAYVASWVALPLRTDLIQHAEERGAEYAARRTAFNREFFKTAISLYPKRGTLPGLHQLLRAWLQGELLPDFSVLILTDLTRSHNDVDTVFQLAPEKDEDKNPNEIYAQVGLTTVLGEGPPFLFIADLITDPTLRELRQPQGLDTFQRAARFLLESEKPAHTYYQLRVRAHTMQLAAAGETQVNGRPAAQVGETTLLWDEPWIWNSAG